MTPVLIIQHLFDNHFQLVGVNREPLTPPVVLTDPASLRVVGWEEEHSLPSGLRWYFERYLRCPASAFTLRANQVQTTLAAWGQESFERLFQDPRAQVALHQMRARGPGWGLRVQSEESRVLAWPWEALRDPKDADVIGLNAAVERCVPSGIEPLPLPSGLATDRIRVLLLIPRGEAGDVGYRAISGALVDRIARATLPVEITVLRPPTIRALKEALDSDQAPYHIVHVDGHGAQEGDQSYLVFEKDGGGTERIDARQLVQLLVHQPAPVIVLSACRSGSVDAVSATPFSGIATALLKARVRSVVAMSQVLHRDGAAEFVPDFYRELIRGGSIARAAMRGRVGMQASALREAYGGGRVPLWDYTLPVVYQNQPVTLSLSPAAPPWRRPRRLPDEALLSEPLPYRDPEILTLERALRDPRRVTVVTGSEKVGKTVLAMDFATWLDQTGWPGRVDWMGLAGLGSASALLNRMGMIHGQEFFARSEAEKIRAIVQGDGGGAALLTVWDGLDATEAWSAADQATLGRLVDALPGQRLRILATARARPGWMADAKIIPIHLDY